MSDIIHQGLAGAYRRLPAFRGKALLGSAIGKSLAKVGISPRGHVTVKMRDGSLMRLDRRSRTEDWAYWTGEYDLKIINRLKTCLKPGCTVMDVGANVGFYSIPFGRHLGSTGGRVFSFEPVSGNFEVLSNVIRLNGLEKVVFPQNLALGDEEGTIELHLEDDGGVETGNAVIVKCDVTKEYTANRTARIAKLDELVKGLGIESCRLIKVDIEGAELMFLRGGSGFIAHAKPVIYGEFNAYWMKRFGHSFLDVAELVQPWGYTFFRETGPGQFQPVAEPRVGLENVLLVPPGVSKAELSELGVVDTPQN